MRERETATWRERKREILTETDRFLEVDIVREMERQIESKK